MGSGDISISASTSFADITGQPTDNANLSTALNSKVNTSDLTECHVVITTYISGTDGYRIWSDGYCEQWGVTSIGTSELSVTLVKTFANTNYSCLISCRHTTTPSVHIYPTAANVISMKASSGTQNCSWMVCGYLAEGEY